MVARGDVVLLDTMVILEAHRCHCWKGLHMAFSLESAERCLQELTPKRAGSRQGFVEVDAEAVRGVMKVHDVSQRDLAELRLKLMNLPDVDEGEEALLAHALQRTDAWLVSAPDKALIRALSKFKLMDRYVTLEEMSRVGGCRPARDLERQHTAAWISEKRTQLLMGGEI
jgi:hypothetical protein